MAAGQGFKTFTTGEVLTATDVNGYLMQGVLVFASAAARNAAITSPQEGQFAFTKDTNGLWYYDGAAWVASGATGDIEGVTAGTGISGGGTSGTVTVTNTMATAIDAKGDLIAGTGADAFSRLAVGANTYILTADSAEATGLKWAAAAGATSFPAFSVYRGTSNQTIASDTWTKVQLNAENFDTANCFDSTTNYRFTPTVEGYYQLNGSIFMLASTGTTYVAIYKNGSAFQNIATYANSLYMSAGILMYFNGSSDYIELYGYQDSGSSSSIRFASNATSLSGVGVKS